MMPKCLSKWVCNAILMVAVQLNGHWYGNCVPKGSQLCGIPLQDYPVQY